VALPVARIYLGLCVLHDFPSRRFWWERLNGPAKRFTPNLNKSQKLLNRQQSAGVRDSDNAGISSETKPSDPSG
jgi:hypothetical protein